MENTQELNVRSEEVQEILTQVPSWMVRWGNIVILGIFLIMFALSWIIEYPDIITANITITTQTPPEKLVARSTGKIEKIFIKNASSVSSYQPLAVIQNNADYDDVFKLKNIVDKLTLNKENNYFPFDKLTDMRLGDIENSFAVFERDYIDYTLNRKLQPYKIDESAQQFEGSQLKSRLLLLNQQKEIALNSLNLKRKELERFKKLYEKGVIATQEFETKSMEYMQSEKDIRILNSSLSQLHSSINEISRNYKTTKINETKDDVTLYRNMLQSYNLLKKAINDWELSYVIKSSISGEITFLQIWTENQEINEGDNIFTIIPVDINTFVGKIKAVAQNSGKIKKGQNVNIRLANYPDKEFGVIMGKIEYMSLIPDKDGNILIDVSLPNRLETSYHKKILFQQEMTGTADIVTQDLRLIERLLYQLREVFVKRNYISEKK